MKNEYLKPRMWFFYGLLLGIIAFIILKTNTSLSDDKIEQLSFSVAGGVLMFGTNMLRLISPKLYE